MVIIFLKSNNKKKLISKFLRFCDGNVVVLVICRDIF